MLLLIIMLLKDVRLILVRLDLDKMGESQKIRNYELFDTSLSPVISFLNSLRRGHGNDVLSYLPVCVACAHPSPGSL